MSPRFIAAIVAIIVSFMSKPINKFRKESYELFWYGRNTPFPCAYRGKSLPMPRFPRHRPVFSGIVLKRLALHRIPKAFDAGEEARALRVVLDAELFELG